MKLQNIKIWTAGLLLAAAGTSQSRPLNVVATTPEMGALASAIGGERVRVRSISSGREDPHFLEARPTFMVMARNADLWIRTGMELEIGWEPIILDRSRNPEIRIGQRRHFDGGSYIAYALEVPDATTTRAMGDVHPSGNPHYMLDPLNARLISIALADRLASLDPANKSAYEEGLKSFLKRLDTSVFGEVPVERIGGDRLWQAEREGRLDALLEEHGLQDALGGWMAAMRPWKDKPVITFHKNWSYLAHRFGFRVIAELEPLPGVPPTPSHLARVLDLANQQEVRLVLKAPWYPKRPATFITRSSPAELAVASIHPTELSADGYFNWMESIISVFKKN